MLRLMLVEDEPFFRKALAKMITSSETNWTVCAESENGRDAEQQILLLRPDLVITDIRMPLVDGTELMQRIRDHGLTTEFIVITGFQDFHYAQAALRCGAIDLLVKPCSKQEVDRVMLKAETVIQQKLSRQREGIRELRTAQENTMRSILLRMPCTQDQQSELNSFLAEEGFTAVVMLEIQEYFPEHKQYQRSDLPLLQFAVLNMLGELIHDLQVEGWLMLIESGRFGLFIKPSADVAVIVKESCLEIKKWLGLSMEANVLGRFYNLSELVEKYELACKDGQLLSYHLAAEDRHRQSEAVSSNWARQQSVSLQVSSFIVEGKTEELRLFLNELLSEIQAMSLPAQKIEVLSIVFALREMAAKHLESRQDSSRLSERIKQLHASSNQTEIISWGKSEIVQFLSELSEWQQKYSVNAITKAIQYIEENYAETISLQDVASHIHLNASYFSHLFKKETGCSFVNYLIERRMEKAKQLLRNTNLNVTEIAGLVGYHLPNYFAKLFRQTTGLSPKEFRNNK